MVFLKSVTNDEKLIRNAMGEQCLKTYQYSDTEVGKRHILKLTSDFSC